MAGVINDPQYAQVSGMQQGMEEEYNLGNLSDETVRQGFVRKVYGLLSVQLFVTALIAAPIVATADTKWLIENSWMPKTCMMISLIAILGVGCCCQSAARTYPTNYLFLGLVTVCEAVIVGFISAMYTLPSVLMAAGLTGGIFVGLTIFAFTTKQDFTGMGGYLYAAVMGLILTSFLCIFFPFSPMMQKIMAGAGAIIFSMYIVYDTQLIVGGKHKKHQFGPDDYVFAALNIYLDIINLFLYLLQLFGDRK
jgi:FtsH-binding integral membrane protein